MTVRRYGEGPFRVAVLHGGPGAAGAMAPVARELADAWGVLEPLQSARSVQGQVDELRAALVAHGAPPLVLVGHSWGAWLGFILAAQQPALLRRLILVGSGPFAASYAQKIMSTRLARLSPSEAAEARALQAQLAQPGTADRDALLARFGALMQQSDAYDPLPAATEAVAVDADVYAAVWPEAAALRASGELVRMGRQITCPVVAVHGAYDPHPAAGVRDPLAEVLADFRFVLLAKCGHEPWQERQAREPFFALLRDELASAFAG